MMLTIPGVLAPEQVAAIRRRLDTAGAAWVDGRATAGHQGAHVKRNLQIAEDTATAHKLGDIVVAALERHPLFLSAVLPARIYPPLFNRYESATAMAFGDHVDGAIRLLPGTAVRIRTDVSATLFLTPPDEYDGGELQVEDTYGAHSVKLAAGDLVLYPASSVHRVTPVTRGTRVACFFWVQSLVRDDAQRAQLFDLDMAIVRLTQDVPGHASLVPLTGHYHNLLRMWATP
jgi:PKHD-type hydroxylase